MNKTSIYYLVIGLTIFGLIFYWLGSSPQLVDNQQKELPFKSEYFIQNVTIKYFDKNGLLENQLNASKLEHFKWNQTSLISHPLLEIKNKKQSNWQISASSGLLDHANNQIMLHDGVEIKQSSLPKNQETSIENNLIKKETLIKTQNLSFDLNNNFAETKNDVMIDINSLTTIAKTMTIDFNLSKVDLNGQTETTGQLND